METICSIINVSVIDNILFDFMKQAPAISFSYLDIFSLFRGLACAGWSTLVTQPFSKMFEILFRATI